MLRRATETRTKTKREYLLSKRMREKLHYNRNLGKEMTRKAFNPTLCFLSWLHQLPLFLSSFLISSPPTLHLRPTSSPSSFPRFLSNPLRYTQECLILHKECGSPLFFLLYSSPPYCVIRQSPPYFLIILSGECETFKKPKKGKRLKWDWLQMSESKERKQAISPFCLCSFCSICVQFCTVLCSISSPVEQYTDEEKKTNLPTREAEKKKNHVWGKLEKNERTPRKRQQEGLQAASLFFSPCKRQEK